MKSPGHCRHVACRQYIFRGSRTVLSLQGLVSLGQTEIQHPPLTDSDFRRAPLHLFSILSNKRNTRIVPTSRVCLEDEMS